MTRKKRRTSQPEAPNATTRTFGSAQTPTDSVASLTALAALLQAGAEPADAVMIAAPDPVAARQAAAVVTSGGTLAAALTSAGMLDRHHQPLVAALEDQPRPGTSLHRLATWLRFHAHVHQAQRALHRNWSILVGVVVAFAAVSGLAAARTVTVLPWYATAAAWAGVVAPAAVLLTINYRALTQRRSLRALLLRRPQYAHGAESTWADALADALDAGTDWDHAVAQAGTITAAIWDDETWDPAHLSPSLATLLRAGEYTATTADLAHAWAAQTREDTLAALQTSRSQLVVTATAAVSAVMAAYTLLLALPALLT